MFMFNWLGLIYAFVLIVFNQAWNALYNAFTYLQLIIFIFNH